MSLLSRLDRVRHKDASITGEEPTPESAGDSMNSGQAALDERNAASSEWANKYDDEYSQAAVAGRSSRDAAILATAYAAGAYEGSDFDTEPDEFIPSEYGTAGLPHNVPVDMPDTAPDLVPGVMPLRLPSAVRRDETDFDTDVNEHANGSVQINMRDDISDDLNDGSYPGNGVAVPTSAGGFSNANSSTANSRTANVGSGSDGPKSPKSLFYTHKHDIYDDVLSAIDPRLWMEPQQSDVEKALDKALAVVLRQKRLHLDTNEHDWMLKEFVQEVMAFGPLTPLLDDPSISKINVEGAHEVTVERLGVPETTPVSFRDNDHLLSIIRRIAEVVGGRVDPKVPLLDRPLPEGARVRAKVPPLAPQPSLTVEKGSGNPFDAVKKQRAARAGKQAQPYQQLREKIQQRLVRDVEANSLDVTDPDKLRSQVEEMISGLVQEERIAMTRAERAALVTDLLNEIIGLGPLEPLLNDPEIDEVMVNGSQQVYCERRGKIELTGTRFRDNAHVLQIIERMVAPMGRRIDEKSPMVDGRLRDGSRFNAVIPPLALSGPTITIRKFARDPYSMTDLINFKTVSREAAQFIQASVACKLNILVSGGTGSGKTTTLNVLSGFIPSNERIITIEDAAELQMRQDHVIRLETRPANIEGAGEIGIRDLVRNALRMRPDRIIVGECRGAEALDMLQAMNTGHDGSLSTVHSNGPRDTLKRLETMVMMAGYDLPVRAIREQISMAVHLIVHQERMSDGIRRITAITEIVGMESDTITLQDIFRFAQTTIDEQGRIVGSLQPTGLRPKLYETMLEHGISLPMDIFTPKLAEGTEGVRELVKERNKRGR